MSLRLALRARRPLAAACLARTRPALTRAVSTPAPEPLRMPPDMPREDYATPAAHALGTLGNVVKYLVYGGITLVVLGVAGYEGVHLYVENVCLASPTRSTAGDVYGWEDENLPFTGGLVGGTDPRLGWKGRHALRGAYIAWQWGAGHAAAIQRDIHPELRRGVVKERKVVDRGYELADEYIDLATKQAEAKGIKFPPELDAGRAIGPPTDPPVRAEADHTALDLLALKAGILERISTPETLAHARDLYERVLLAERGMADSDVATARVVRLAHKIGDLALRAGDRAEAEAWWAYGVKTAGVAVPDAGLKDVQPEKPSKSCWWPFGGSTPKPAAAAVTTVPTALLPESSLSPALQRATTSILVAASAHAAQTGHLEHAAALQALAASLLPSPPWVNGRLGVSVPNASNRDAVLQDTWVAARVALLELHRASIAHARRDKSVDTAELASEAAEHAEAVLATLTPTLPAAFTVRGAPTAQPAERLLRDTLMTGAEAQYTHAILLERQAAWCKPEDRVHVLEHASEAFERAMSLSAAESGSTDNRKIGEMDEVGRGEEWVRYYRGYVRTREKIMALVTGNKEEDK